MDTRPDLELVAAPPPPAQPSSPPRRRSGLGNLLGVVLAFALLGLAVAQNRAELGKVFARHVDLRFFGVGLAVYLTSLLITFGRWFLLVRAQGIPFALRDALRLGFIGNVFNLVIPGAVGGDVIKAAYLGRMFPERRAAGWASMVIDRILGLLGLFLLAGVAGLANWGSADAQVRVLIGLIWGALVVGLVGLGVLFSPVLYRPLNRVVAGRGRLAVAVQRLEAIGLAYRRRLGTVVGMLGVAVLCHGLYVVAFFVASAALFDAMPTLAEHFLMVPLVLFTTAVPLPFGALGLSEQISGRLFALVHHTDGAVAMMAFRVLMYASGAVSALVYLANLRQVRTLRRDASDAGGVAAAEPVAETR